jgi:hypothetical protein
MLVLDEPQVMGLAETPYHPNVISQRQESILHSVVVTGTSVLGIAYMLTTVPTEKRKWPMVLGWMAMGGLWWIGLEGLSGILHHLSCQEEKPKA